MDDRLTKVAAYAKEHIHLSAGQYQGGENMPGPQYRWEHTLRVANYGRIIAEAEGADVEIVTAACLLHDTEWYVNGEHRDHGRIAAREIRPFLGEIGYSPEQVENICYSVAVHVDGIADFEHRETVEAKAVTDADNIDRFGAYRVLFQCIDYMDDYEEMIRRLRSRVEKLEDYCKRDVLETTKGNELFKQQLARQIAYYKWMVEEYELTRLPE